MFFYTSSYLTLTIVSNKNKISESQREIDQSQIILDNNNKYKSILFTNGEELVSVVFDILEQILAFNLSEFKDNKKEDFLIQLEKITFIGEIKGVTSNIKSENISQLDVHYQNYLEKIEEEGKEENVKAILIMNHQRNHPLLERQPVTNAQITLAKRNNSLIIESNTLLKIYEGFLNGKYDTKTIIEMFENSGLLII